MTGMSRRKGAVGERELAHELAELTGWMIRRRVRQHEGDSDLEGLRGWSIEVKRRASARPGDVAAWWRQAFEQGQRAGAIPVLFTRVDRQAWRAHFPLAVLVGADWAAWGPGAQFLLEGSLECWAAVARELMPITTAGP
jgi:hypothetical protein